MSILELRGTGYTYRTQYQQVEALKGVSYSFETGKLHAIMGRSGSGKTTLLSLMAGLDLPTAGQVLFEGTSTAEMDLERYRREKAAVIYQNFRLFPLLTVAENVMYPMELQGMRPKHAKEKAAALVERAGLPSSVLNRFPTMLSGGEQQRVAIARALAKNPKLLLCDEPTGALDYNTGKAVLKLLQNTCREVGKTVIVITHNQALTAMADRVITVKSGTIFSMEKNENIVDISEIEW